MEKSLKDLLARLPIPGLKESNDRHVIADVITKLFNIPVSPKQILVKEGIIIVSVPPVMKSALHLKQSELLSQLQEMGIRAQGVR